MNVTAGLTLTYLALFCVLPCMASTDATAILNAQKDYFAQLRNVAFKSTQTVLLDPIMEMRILNRTGRKPEFPLAISQVSRFEDNRFYFTEQIPEQQPYNTNGSFYDGTTYTIFIANDRTVFHKPAHTSSADPVGTDNPFLLLFTWAKRSPTEFSYRSLHDKSYWNGPFDIVSVEDSGTSPGTTIVGLNLPHETRHLYAEATFSHALDYFPITVTTYDLSSDPATSSVVEEVKLLEIAHVDAGTGVIPVPVAVSYHKALTQYPQKNRYQLYDFKVNQVLSPEYFVPPALPQGYIEVGPTAMTQQVATVRPSFAQERSEWAEKARKADAEFFAKQNDAATLRTKTLTSAAQTTGTTAHELLEKALAQAMPESKKVFLLCVTSHSGWCKLLDRFHALPTVKVILDKYYVVARLEIDKLPDGRDEFSAFGEATPPAWVIMDPDKRVLCTSKCRNVGNVGYPTFPHEIAHFTKALKASSKITPGEVKIVTAGLEMMTPYYEPEKARAAVQMECKDDFDPSNVAGDLVTSALSAAAAESKNVFLLSGFPECGWCKLFDRYHALPQVERILKSYYVIEKIDIENMPDGETVFEKYAEPGAPAWVILDPSGKVLVTSSDEHNGNVGYPTAPSETAHYEKALKATSSISEAEAKVLNESLLKTAGRVPATVSNP